MFRHITGNQPTNIRGINRRGKVPGGLLARGQPEGDTGLEGERRVLARVVVTGRVSDLDDLLLDRIQNLQAGHDLAGRVAVDAEPTARERIQTPGQKLRVAVQSVQPAGEAGGQAPLQALPVLHRGARRGPLDEFPPLQLVQPVRVALHVSSSRWAVIEPQSVREGSARSSGLHEKPYRASTKAELLV